MRSLLAVLVITSLCACAPRPVAIDAADIVTTNESTADVASDDAFASDGEADCGPLPPAQQWNCYQVQSGSEASGVICYDAPEMPQCSNGSWTCRGTSHCDCFGPLPAGCTCAPGGMVRADGGR